MRSIRWVVTWLLLITIGAMANIARAQEPETISTTFTELGINDFAITGLNGSATLFFPIQGNWEPAATEIEITLKYAVSTRIMEESATLTIEAGGVPISTTSLAASERVQEITFSVPTTALNEFGLNLRISPLLPTTEDVCAAYRDPSQWLRVLGSSEITYNPTLRTDEPVLRDLGERLLPAAYLPEVEPVETYLVLPDASTPTDLTVASQITARLGRLNRLYPFQAPQVIFTADLSDEIMSTSNLIFVGTPDDLPFFAADGDAGDDNADLPALFAAALATPLSPDVLTERIGADSGYIGVFSESDNPSLVRLVVVAATDESLALLGDVFAHTPTYATLTGADEIVDRLLPVDDTTLRLPWLTPTTSLAQLGVPTQRLSGIGVSQNRVEILMPAGAELTSDSTLTLNWLASPALAAETSFITVYLNDVLLATLSPAEDHLTLPQQAEIPLPAHLLNVSPDGTRTQRYQLRIDTSNAYQGSEDCPDEEGAWVEVQNSSFFNVGLQSAALPDLQVFPYPFISFETRASTALIVPANPDAALLSDVMALTTMLGRHATRDFTLHLLPADQVDEATLADHHLIVIGSAETNPVLAEISDTLPEDEAITEFSEDAPAFIRSAISPFNADKSVLLISATSPANLTEVTDLFTAAFPPVQSPADFLVLHSNDELVTVEFLEAEQLAFNATAEPVVEFTPQAVNPYNQVVVVTATPSTSQAAASDTTATTEETAADSPISSELSFVIIIVLAALVLPFAFAITRNSRD